MEEKFIYILILMEQILMDIFIYMEEIFIYLVKGKGQMNQLIIMEILLCLILKYLELGPKAQKQFIKVFKKEIKGNQKYAFYSGVITKDKKLEIRDENDALVKDGEITKDINYIFYSSLKLNEKYNFYLIEDMEKNKINMTFGQPKVRMMKI